MRYLKSCVVVMLSVALSLAHAAEVGGVSLEERLEVEGTALTLNGAGVRNKYFMNVYVAGLYLPEPGKDAAAIMNADEVQAMTLHITSSMITRARFQETVQEGLKQSAGDEYPRYEHLLDDLWEDQHLEVNKGDVFQYYYVPGEGTRFMRNGTTLKVVEGLDFKRVLFGIYVGENPVQTSLKQELLGEE